MTAAGRPPGSRSSTAGARRSRPSMTRALDRDERVDRDLLLGELAVVPVRRDRAPRGRLEPARVGLPARRRASSALIAREFAPLADRLASVAARAEGLPAVLDAAASALVGLEDRPVDRLHTEKALEQWPGLIGIVDEAIAAGEAAAAPAIRRSPRSCPGCARRATVAADGARRLRGAPPRRRPAGVGRARAGSGRTCSPRRWPTRCATRR